MGLRIHINQQRLMAQFGKSTCQIYRYRCLATPPFLIDNRYGPHNLSPDSKPPTRKTPFYRKDTLFNAGKQLNIYLNNSAKKMKKLYLLWDEPIKKQTKVTVGAGKHPRGGKRTDKNSAEGVFSMPTSALTEHLSKGKSQCCGDFADKSAS
jgi:hypothetical protein